MSRLARHASRRTALIAVLATMPAATLAAFAAPCPCPEHDARAIAAIPHQAHSAHHAGGHGDRTGAAPASTPATASHHAAPANGTHAAGGARSMAWVVGTPRTPLVLRQDAGALALGDAPTEEPVAARAHAARASTEPVGVRSALSTAQATAKLSRRCRKLLKVKRPSRLSRSDRRKRSACLKQRRKLIADSTAPTPTPTPSPTTPTPTPAPTTPIGSTPGPGPTPTPSPSSSPCAGKNPCVGAIGVQAKDSMGRFIFMVSKLSVEADRVAFIFENHDAQDHNLFVQPKGRPDLAQPVSTLLAPGGMVRKDLDLAPGTYTLRCLIEGHETMTVDITVTAPVR